jgi:hypothetical protein
MAYLITSTVGLLIGFIAGALFFRNNARKLTDKEMEGKRLIDALKGR